MLLFIAGYLALCVAVTCYAVGRLTYTHYRMLRPHARTVSNLVRLINWRNVAMNFPVCPLLLAAAFMPSGKAAGPLLCDDIVFWANHNRLPVYHDGGLVLRKKKRRYGKPSTW